MSFDSENQSESSPQDGDEVVSPPSARSRLRRILVLALLAASVPVAFTGWQAGIEFYEEFLERNPPVITINQIPRGLGLTPVSVGISVTDSGGGLDEIIIRVVQRGKIRDLGRRSLDGAATGALTVELSPQALGLEEGKADIVLQAFDRSFWSNRAEKLIAMQVDYRKPRIEVVSTQHNARSGGAQLIFYKAFDEDLAVSGVRVGPQVFEGFPARGIDKDFEDPSLFVAIYAPETRPDSPEIQPRVFAEDKVGNATSISFYNKVLEHRERESVVRVTDELLRNEVSSLAEQNMGELERMAVRQGQPLFNARPGTEERLLEYFAVVNGPLRVYNESVLQSYLKGPRYDRYFDGPFQQFDGVAEYRFGDNLKFLYNGKEIGTVRETGYQIKMNPGAQHVRALNAGIVVFSDNLGIFGRAVAIDHGLGLVTLYGSLSDVLVTKGERIKSGQPIGIPGRTGFALSRGYRLEMRVHGFPVDILEWSDGSWFYAHVTDKINDVKRALGIQVLQPLR